MDIFTWWQIISAVIAGNGLSLSVGYYIYQGTMRQRQGLSFYDMPLGVSLAGAVPLLIAAAGVISIAHAAPSAKAEPLAPVVTAAPQ